jgi:hypothetical protein
MSRLPYGTLIGYDRSDCAGPSSIEMRRVEERRKEQKGQQKTDERTEQERGGGQKRREYYWLGVVKNSAEVLKRRAENRPSVPRRGHGGVGMGCPISH